MSTTAAAVAVGLGVGKWSFSPSDIAWADDLWAVTKKNYEGDLCLNWLRSFDRKSKKMANYGIGMYCPPAPPPSVSAQVKQILEEKGYRVRIHPTDYLHWMIEWRYIPPAPVPAPVVSTVQEPDNPLPAPINPVKHYDE